MVNSYFLWLASHFLFFITFMSDAEVAKIAVSNFGARKPHLLSPLSRHLPQNTFLINFGYEKILPHSNDLSLS